MRMRTGLDEFAPGWKKRRKRRVRKESNGRRRRRENLVMCGNNLPSLSVSLSGSKHYLWVMNSPCSSNSWLDHSRATCCCGYIFFCLSIQFLLLITTWAHLPFQTISKCKREREGGKGEERGSKEFFQPALAHTHTHVCWLIATLNLFLSLSYSLPPQSHTLILPSKYFIFFDELQIWREGGKTAPRFMERNI